MSTVVRNKFTNEIDAFYDETYTELPPGHYPALHQVEAGTPELKLEWIKQQARKRRNILLAECDWTQLPDCELSPEKQAEWKAYRQALRDLPETIVDPEQEIVWPSKPQS